MSLGLRKGHLLETHQVIPEINHMRVREESVNAASPRERNEGETEAGAYKTTAADRLTP
jgi:hypothetical protein